MAKFRSKPKHIEAVQWDGTDEAFTAIETLGAAFGWVEDDSGPRVGRLIAGKAGAQEDVPVPVGHWVVTDGSGDDFWPVDPDYFAANYEPVLPARDEILYNDDEENL